MPKTRLCAVQSFDRNKSRPRGKRNCLAREIHRTIAIELRELVVGSSIEVSTRYLLARSTPLLEKEWNTISAALFLNRPNPSWLHRTRTWAAFPADDYP